MRLGMALLKIAGTTALVTGASSGIGASIARELACRGAHLVIVARREDALGRLAEELRASFGVGVTVLACDLAAPGSAGRLVEELGARALLVDHLVNCAGVGAIGPVTDLGVERQRDLLHLNVLTLTELTAALVPGMVRRGRGGVLQVGSAVAFFPLPWLAAYAASKAYVRSFSEALRQELQGTGVSVTLLCPGYVPSGFQKAASFAPGASAFPGQRSPAQVARAAVSGYERRRAEVVPGLVPWFGRWSLNFVPNRLIVAVAQEILKRMGRVPGE